MNEKDLNTEQNILNAAEQVFLEKGFATTKTTEIAKKAGVTHAMLHYYFRTKENLFNIVFQNKVRLLANSFFSVDVTGKSFTEVVSIAVGRHFDFIKENRKLAPFIINEINNNEKNSETWQEIAQPIFAKVAESIIDMMDAEIKKGTIRPMSPFDLIQTVVSLNIFPFVAQPLLKILRHVTDEEYNVILEQRKHENIRLVLLSLQP